MWEIDVSTYYGMESHRGSQLLSTILRTDVCITITHIALPARWAHTAKWGSVLWGGGDCSMTGAPH